MHFNCNFFYFNNLNQSYSKSHALGQGLGVHAYIQIHNYSLYKGVYNHPLLIHSINLKKNMLYIKRVRHTYLIQTSL